MFFFHNANIRETFLGILCLPMSHLCNFHAIFLLVQLSLETNLYHIQKKIWEELKQIYIDTDIPYEFEHVVTSNFEIQSSINFLYQFGISNYVLLTISLELKFLVKLLSSKYRKDGKFSLGQSCQELQEYGIPTQEKNSMFSIQGLLSSIYSFQNHQKYPKIVDILLDPHPKFFGIWANTHMGFIVFTYIPSY